MGHGHGFGRLPRLFAQDMVHALVPLRIYTKHLRGLYTGFGAKDDPLQLQGCHRRRSILFLRMRSELQANQEIMIARSTTPLLEVWSPPGRPIGNKDNEGNLALAAIPG